MQELFRLFDVNGNSDLEKAEFDDVIGKVSILFGGKDSRSDAARASFDDVFRNKLDDESWPLPYQVFRTRVLRLLSMLESDAKAQTAILQRFINETRKARAEFPARPARGGRSAVPSGAEMHRSAIWTDAGASMKPVAGKSALPVEGVPSEVYWHRSAIWGGDLGPEIEGERTRGEARRPPRSMDSAAVERCICNSPSLFEDLVEALRLRDVAKVRRGMKEIASLVERLQLHDFPERDERLHSVLDSRGFPRSRCAALHREAHDLVQSAGARASRGCPPGARNSR